jgi:hypothetical protein
MQSNLTFVMDRIFLSEGGFAAKETEPGGAVNRGISFLVYQGWCASHDRPAPTFETLKNMSRDEAEDIYEALYFAPARFDQVQSGVDYSVVDFCHQFRDLCGADHYTPRSRIHYAPGSSMAHGERSSLCAEEPSGRARHQCDLRRAVGGSCRARQISKPRPPAAPSG